MEVILDFEYVLREVEQDRSEDGISACEAARRNFHSERNALFQAQKEIDDFREYGAPFEGATAPDPPEWSRFINDCQNYLANKSKDLWICVWMTEVLIAQSGFRGLAEGFRLIRETSERYWDQLEPSPTAEGGVEYTVKLVASMSGESFTDAIRFAPITMESGQYLPASCATIDSIDGGERGALVGDSTDEFISELYLAIKNAIKEWGSIDEVLESKCGEDAPPSVKVRDNLNDCLNQIVDTYPQVIVEDEPEDGEIGGGAPSEDNSGISNGGALSGDSRLRNREQAFKTLEKLSRYFAENEPNSPIASLLRQAARYGRLSFAELMQELAEDEDARNRILRLAGAGDGNEQHGDKQGGYQEESDEG